MSPKAFRDSTHPDQKPHAPDCTCRECIDTERRRLMALYGYPVEKPGLNWSIGRWLTLLAIALALVALLLGVGIAGRALIDQAHAREGKTPQPIAAPQSLLKARYACPNTATLAACRGELRRAYASVEWQRKARLAAKATTVREITLDAIKWASARYGVSRWEMQAVANCESHLWPFATNGQYLGVFQLGATHRTDPIFQHVPWQDAYAQASHVARFVKAHSWSAWQCRPEGGLRW